MGQRKRKLMTIHEALHHRDDVDKQYTPRKEGGRGITSIEDTSIRRLEDYIKKSKETLITATRSNTNNIRINRTTITRKQQWEGKQLYGHFKRLTSEISHEKSWKWLRKGNLKRETEFLQTVQNIAIRTNSVKEK